MVRWLALIALLILAAFPARASDRVALVIGNADYAELGRLANPGADAQAMADLLEARLGFKVRRLFDADQAAMMRAVAEFGRASADADIALFFYAGHGVEMEGVNYLLPVGAEFRSDVDLVAQAFRLDQAVEVMARSGARAKIVLIDACRNNPLPSGLFRGARSMGLRQAVLPGVDTLIAFATLPGQVAFDGAGRHSPFTQGLLDNLGTPGTHIIPILYRVRSAVYQATDKRQFPWWDDMFLTEVRLADDSAQVASAGAAKPDTVVAGIDPGEGEAVATRGVTADTAGAKPQPEEAIALVYRPVSLWRHNGSVLALSAQGRRRTLHYERPRAGMVAAGVSRGTLLFKGELVDGQYVGQAFVFSKACGPLAYAVRGPVDPDQLRVELRGKKPVRDRDCRLIGTTDDRLVFEWMRTL